MSNYFENIEWKAQRLGKMTASEIHKIMKGGRQKDQLFGQTALKYIEEKIAEIITGEAKQLDGIKALEWGAANELDAITLFGQQHHESVEFFGVGNPEFFQWKGVAGGTPDGLTETAVIEVKCPFVSANHVGFLMASKLSPSDHEAWLYDNWPEYYYQVQMNMLACDRKTSFLVSYDPRTVKHEHCLAVLSIDANADVQMEIDYRISEAKKIIKRALDVLDQKPADVTSLLTKIN